MVKDMTLYDRLHVKSDASESEIKKSYIHLSKINHPDKHPEEMKEQATQTFKELLEAKEVLLDSEKRNRYNQIGMDMFKQNQPDFPGGFPGFPGGFPGFPGGFPGFPGEFPGFPGEFPGFPGFNVNIQNIETTLKVRLDQIYKQDNVTVSYIFNKYCEDCQGEGGLLQQCQDCNGNGRRIHIQQMGNMISQSITNCDRCKGKGRSVKSECKSCKGKGTHSLPKTIQFPLSRNIESGNRIHIKSEGNWEKDMRSDLIILIEVLPHDVFKVRNKDLIMNVEISLLEALFGFHKKIKWIDDNDIDIQSDKVTQYNKVSVIKGKGMTEKNDLYIIYTFTLPSLSEEYKDVLKDIFVETPKKVNTDNIDVITYFLN